MALFKAKEPQQQPPPFDASAFEQRIMNQVGLAINAAMQPIVSAMQALSTTRQAPPEEVDEEPTQQLQKSLTPEQVRQLIRESQEEDGNSNQYVPKARQQGLNTFRKGLTSEGRDLFDKYNDEVEAFIDNLPLKQQANPEAWEGAFEFAMIRNHKPEYMQILMSDAKPEDLPPHLQSPGGMGGTTTESEPELTDDEKEVMGLFNSTKHSAKRFTPQQMKDFREINPNFRLTMDQMIEQAKEKGLIKNGSASTNPGNNA